MGDKLKEVQQYNQELGGTLSVWVDPADGVTYVVNGHHRLELGQRANAPSVDVRYLDAATAAEARAKGALINIAEDQGTALDAAKLFRDSNITPADLKAQGIALNGKVARAGLGLSHLTLELFERVVSGDIPIETGSAVGEMLPGRMADQRAVVEAIDKAAGKGKPMTPAQVRESIRVGMRSGAEITEHQDTLFGTVSETRSLFAETGEISDYIRKQLSSEKRLFGTVGSQAAAERLGGAGNVINATENSRIAGETTQAQAVYEKLSGMSGAVSDAIANGARDLAGGGASAAVKAKAYEAVRQAITETLNPAKPGLMERAKEAIGELARDTTGSVGRLKPKSKNAAQLYDAEHQVSMFDEPASAAAAASDNGTAAALKDALTKEMKYGRGKGGSVGGPMFDDQQGLFGDTSSAPAGLFDAPVNAATSSTREKALALGDAVQELRSQAKDLASKGMELLKAGSEADARKHLKTADELLARADDLVAREHAPANAAFSAPIDPRSPGPDRGGHVRNPDFAKYLKETEARDRANNPEKYRLLDEESASRDKAASDKAAKKAAELETSKRPDPEFDKAVKAARKTEAAADRVNAAAGGSYKTKTLNSKEGAKTYVIDRNGGVYPADQLPKGAGTIELTADAGADSLRVEYSQLEPDSHGQGIGKDMYRKALALAAKKGKTFLESDTRVSPEAARVWKSLGAETFDGPHGTRYRLRVPKSTE